MAKLLQFGFLLLLTFFCVSVPSTNAAPIKSVTGCGLKTILMATGVNIVSDFFSDRNEIAVSVRCKQTCTEIEVERNNGRPNSLTVCNGKYNNYSSDTSRYQQHDIFITINNNYYYYYFKQMHNCWEMPVMRQPIDDFDSRWTIPPLLKAAW